MSKLLSSPIAAFLIFAAVAAFFNFYFPTLADIDGYYHIRHAWIYQTQGLFDSDFPWLQYSTIGRLGGDIWYGFHILLTPFTYFDDLTDGMRWVAALTTLFALGGYYFVLKKSDVIWPLFWTMLLFFSVPDVNFRLVMLRPHVLTFVLAIVIFYGLTKKGSGKLIFLASVGLSFVHLALAWLPLLIAAIITITRRIVVGSWGVKKNLIVLAGLTVGWIARPDFVSAIKLAYIQVVQLALEKFKDTPLRFGTELRPGNSLSVVTHEIMPIALLMMAAVIGLIFILKRRLAYQLEKQQTIAIYGSLIISLLFGLLTYGVARRAADIWVGFSLVFVSLIFSVLLKRHPNFYAKFKTKIAAVAAVVFLSLTTNTLKFTWGYFKDAPPEGSFKKSAVWLKENSAPGDIVFNIHWDNFPLLFFWNQSDYYINGMDPIFEYAFSRELYLKHYFIDIDKVFISEGEAYTCGANPCGPGAVASVYDVLKNDFKAKYVFVQIARNPVVFKYLDSNPRFNGVFTNGTEAIFEVLEL